MKYLSDITRQGLLGIHLIPCIYEQLYSYFLAIKTGLSFFNIKKIQKISLNNVFEQRNHVLEMILLI